MSKKGDPSSVIDQGQNLGDTMNAATRITMNANTILQQPDITLDELKNLPAHQKAVRGHSNVWLENVWPSIIGLTADIIGYANTFDSCYKSLLTLVDKLQSGDQEAKKEFKQVLTEVLLPALNEQEIRSTKVTSDALGLKNEFQTDYTNFQADHEAAEQAYTSEGGELTVLQGEYKAAQAKVHSLEIALIAAGASDGALLIATAVVELFTEGTATPVLMAGAVAGLGVTAAIAAEYSDAVRDMTDLQKQIQTLQNQLDYLNAISAQIQGFEACIADTVAASQQVVDGWTVLAADLSKVIDELDQISPEDAAIIITIHLNAANADWQVVLEQAKVLQPSGQIPVKNFDGVDSFLDAITPKQG